MYQAQQPVQGVVLKCPYCGSPLEVSPDDIVTICKYCGNIVNLRKGIERAHVVRALPRSRIEEKVYKELKGRGIAPTPLWSRIVYLPFFLYDATVDAVVVKEYKDREGRVHTRTVEYRRDVSASVYGRFSEFEGLDVVMDAVEREIKKGKVEMGSVNPEDAQYVKILGPQKTEEDALREARERAEFNASPIRAKGLVGAIGASLTGVVFYDARNIDLTYKGLYFYPVFFYLWRTGGKVYLTIADGATGKVLLTHLPIPDALRKTALAVAAVSPILFIPLIGVGLSAPLSFLLTLLVGVGAGLLAVRGDIVWRPIGL